MERPSTQRAPPPRPRKHHVFARTLAASPTAADVPGRPGAHPGLRLPHGPAQPDQLI